VFIAMNNAPVRGSMLIGGGPSQLGDQLMHISLPLQEYPPVLEGVKV